MCSKDRQNELATKLLFSSQSRVARAAAFELNFLKNKTKQPYKVLSFS